MEIRIPKEEGGQGQGHDAKRNLFRQRLVNDKRRRRFPFPDSPILSRVRYDLLLLLFGLGSLRVLCLLLVLVCGLVVSPSCPL